MVLLTQEQHQQGDLDPEILQIKNVISQCQQDIQQRHSELEQLTAERDDRTIRVAEAKEGLAVVEAELTEVQATLALEGPLPQRIAKQAEHQYGHTIKSYKVQLGEAKELHSRLSTDVQQFDEQRAVLAKEASELAVTREHESRALDSVSKAAEHVALELERKRNAKRDVLAENARATELLKLAIKNIKRQEELVCRQQREKDAGLRRLRTIEVRKLHIQSQAGVLASNVDTLLVAVKAKKLEAADFETSVRAAREDVEVISRKYDGREGNATAAKVQLKNLKARVAKATAQAAAWQQTNNELLREYRNKHHELDQAIAKSMGQTLSAQRAQHEIGNKDAIVTDSKKSLRAIEAALKELELVYQVVKNEKNKFVTQISNSHQRQTEMKEKVRILSNETEILRTSVLEKDAKVHKKAQEFNDMKQRQTQHQNNMTKIRNENNERKDLLKSMKVSSQKQDEMIQELEAQIQDTKMRCTKVEHDKNALGHVFEQRQAELLKYHEKLGIYRRMIRTGDLKIQEREEDIRFLKLHVLELERAKRLAREQLPNKEAAMRELIKTREDLLETQRKVQKLEEQIESPTSARKWRKLDGSEPTPMELDEKAEQLAARLLKNEEMGLERELVLAETRRLTERARAQVEGGRADTLSLARSVNDYQAKIKDVSRKLMAHLSELSMYHSECIGGEQEMHTLSQTAQEARQRLARGDAPTQEAAVEWSRLERRLEQDSKEQEMRDLGIAVDGEEAMGTRDLTSGVRTFAQLRPNAYIPEGSDDLPVPKPYGRDAPFNPSGPSAHLRHYRPAIKNAN
jgi:chromosome segregation ATPase